MLLKYWRFFAIRLSPLKRLQKSSDNRYTCVSALFYLDMLKLTNHKENASNESLEIKLAILILAGD